MKKLLMLLLHIVLLYVYANAQNTYYTVNKGSWSDPTVWSMNPNGNGPAGPPTSLDNVVISDSLYHYAGPGYVHVGNVSIEPNGVYGIYSGAGSNQSYIFAGNLMDIYGSFFASGDFNQQEDGSNGSGIVILHPGGRLHLTDDLIINASGSLVLDNPECGSAFSCDDIYFVGSGASLCGEGSLLVPGQVRVWDDSGNEITSFSSALATIKQQICQNFPIYASQEDCEKDDPLLVGSGISFPVEFLSLESNPTPFGVEITWETASELNNNYFSLERSSDAKNFKLITRIPGAGTSFEVSQYSFIDDRALKGKSYYRVKQTDFDGTSSYSSIIEVTYEPNNAELSVYPNPVNAHQGPFTVKMESLESNTPVRIALNDLRGREVNVVHAETDFTGRLEKEISVNLPAGKYLVIVTTPLIRETKKIIIQ